MLRPLGATGFVWRVLSPRFPDVESRIASIGVIDQNSIKLDAKTAKTSPRYPASRITSCAAVVG